jgi:hypothetical protein
MHVNGQTVGGDHPGLFLSLRYLIVGTECVQNSDEIPAVQIRPMAQPTGFPNWRVHLKFIGDAKYEAPRYKICHRRARDLCTPGLKLTLLQTIYIIDFASTWNNYVCWMSLYRLFNWLCKGQNCNSDWNIGFCCYLCSLLYVVIDYSLLYDERITRFYNHFVTAEIVSYCKPLWRFMTAQCRPPVLWKKCKIFNDVMKFKKLIYNACNNRLHKYLLN